MDILDFLTQYAKFLVLLTIGYYIIPAGSAYLLFYVIKREKWKHLRVQDRFPRMQTVWLEIRYSLLTLVITAAMVMALFYAVKAGMTRMYFEVSEYGWLYFFFTIPLFIFLYDTHFYWMHRFMHWRKVFPYLHRVHHQSYAPTPWAMLSFDPVEAIMEFAIYPLVLFTIPIHPVVLGIFVFNNIVQNTLGHSGYEVTPRFLVRNPLRSIGLTVTHHDMHHSMANCNYGLYFNIWDRLMGTNHPAYGETYRRVKEKSKAA